MQKPIKLNDKYSVLFNYKALLELEDSFDTRVTSIKFAELKLSEFVSMIKIAIKGGSEVDLSNDEVCSLIDELGLEFIMGKVSQTFAEAFGANTKSTK